MNVEELSLLQLQLWLSSLSELLPQVGKAHTGEHYTAGCEDQRRTGITGQVSVSHFHLPPCGRSAGKLGLLTTELLMLAQGAEKLERKPSQSWRT